MSDPTFRDLSPLVDPERLADYVPCFRGREAFVEAAALLARYRLPRLLRWSLGADADESCRIGARVLAWLCQTFPRDERADLRVLDVGAGVGVLVDQMRAAGFRRAEGIERLPGRALTARLAGLRVRLGDARRLGQSGGRHDVVTFVRVFDAPTVDAEDGRRLVGAAARVLAPGGVLLIGAAGELRRSDLSRHGLRRVHWPNPPDWGRYLHVFAHPDTLAPSARPAVRPALR